MESTQDNALALGVAPIKQLLRHYALPSVVSMVVVSLYNIIDRIFIGQGIGAMAISGLALTLPLMTMTTAIGTLIGIGASARISIVLGMKDVKWARNILGNALLLTFILSAVLTTISMVWLDEILIAFGGSEQTLPYARDYLRIVIPGSVLTNLSFSFSGMMRASGYPKKSMYTILIGVACNSLLDPLFIFGFGWGIQGAAWATVLSMGISTLFVMSHFFNPKHPVHFAAGCLRIRSYIVRNIISIGMAPFIINLTASAVNIAMNHQFLRYGGDLAIGAYGIVNSFAIIVIMGVMGICNGMQPIVGYNYGARNLKRVKEAFLLTLKISVGFMFIGQLLFELTPGVLVRLFTHDEELLRMGIEGMRIAYLMLPAVAYQIVISSLFQSIGNAPKAIFMSLSRQILLLVPLIYILPHWWGLWGVWFALPISDILAAVIGTVMIRGEQRAIYRRPAPTPKEEVQA